MNFPTSFKLVPLRIACASLLAYGLLTPLSAAAASLPSTGTGTGTLVGSITCGGDEVRPAAHASVAVEDINVLTHADSTGRFILRGVPAARNFTIDALSDPTGSLVTSRYNVNVQPGQTLDIGSMDLAVCPQPASPAPAQDNVPADYQHDNGA